MSNQDKNRLCFETNKRMDGIYREQELEKAHALYDKYLGSHFFMVRDEVYKEYERYFVTKEMEKLWAEDLLQHIINKLAGEKKLLDVIQLFRNAGTLVKRNVNEKGLMFMLQYMEDSYAKNDFYTRFMLLKDLIEPIEAFTKDIRFPAIRRTLLVCHRLENEPFLPSDCYSEGGCYPNYLSDVIEETNLRNHLAQIVIMYNKLEQRNT